MKFLCKIRNFGELSKLEKILFFKAFFLSFLIYLAIIILPFKIYIKLVKKSKQTPAKDFITEIGQLNLIKNAINRTSNNVPWELTCLNKSIVFKILAGYLKVDCTISLAAKILEKDKMLAHSFIVHNNKVFYLDNPFFTKKNSLLTIK